MLNLHLTSSDTLELSNWGIKPFHMQLLGKYAQSCPWSFLQITLNQCQTPDPLIFTLCLPPLIADKSALLRRSKKKSGQDSFLWNIYLGSKSYHCHWNWVTANQDTIFAITQNKNSNWGLCSQDWNIQSI